MAGQWRAGGWEEARKRRATKGTAVESEAAPTLAKKEAKHQKGQKQGGQPGVDKPSLQQRRGACVQMCADLLHVWLAKHPACVNGCVVLAIKLGGGREVWCDVGYEYFVLQGIGNWELGIGNREYGVRGRVVGTVGTERVEKHASKESGSFYRRVPAPSPSERTKLSAIGNSRPTTKYEAVGDNKQAGVTRPPLDAAFCTLFRHACRQAGRHSWTSACNVSVLSS